MEKSILATVEIHFLSEAEHENETREVEDLLRKVSNVDNLSVHNEKISFYIWGETTVDYGILDKIKADLKLKKFGNFTITAQEYAKTGKGYFYKEK